MSNIIAQILRVVELFFLIYLLLYASYLFLSVATGAWRLYRTDRMRTIKNELKHEFYFPVSILVPAFIIINMASEPVSHLNAVDSDVAVCRLALELHNISPG